MIQPLFNHSLISPTCTLRSPLPTIFAFTSSFFAAQHLNRLGGLQVRQAFSNVSVHRLMAPRTQQVSSLTSCSCRKSELPNTLSGVYCGLSTVNWFRLEIAKDLSPSSFFNTRNCDKFGFNKSSKGFPWQQISKSRRTKPMHSGARVLKRKQAKRLASRVRSSRVLGAVSRLRSMKKKRCLKVCWLHWSKKTTRRQRLRINSSSG